MELFCPQGRAREGEEASAPGVRHEKERADVSVLGASTRGHEGGERSGSTMQGGVMGYQGGMSADIPRGSGAIVLEEEALSRSGIVTLDEEEKAVSAHDGSSLEASEALRRVPEVQAAGIVVEDPGPSGKRVVRVEKKEAKEGVIVGRVHERVGGVQVWTRGVEDASSWCDSTGEGFVGHCQQRSC